MPESTERTATCSCGAVRVVTRGEPAAVVICHCLACQRRTGSVLGVGAYFRQENVAVHGETREFVRPTDAGNQFVTHFCPVCGTSLHWHSGKNPGLVGVAVGAFGDPSFPTPVRSVWEQSRHAWVDVSCAAQHFMQGRIP
jgi:hypothetical protein